VPSRALADAIGERDVLIGDMGGTSFDCGLVSAGELPIERHVDIGQLRTGVSPVKVVSIRAGGGSIVSVSERGVPQVGPRSAGSTPGPACYGLGGTEPTVTDAMVVLGVLDPYNYLGGRLALRPDLARKAMVAVAEAYGWEVQEAAAAVHDLVVASIANAMREVSVAQGYDPRGFVFMAYGGTLPMFALQIAMPWTSRKWLFLGVARCFAREGCSPPTFCNGMIKPSAGCSTMTRGSTL
jgi:N-methylhydantoinase A